MFVLVVEILAAVGFILFGAQNIADKKPNPAISLMFIPVFIVELIVVFIKNNGINSVPERVYDVVMLALCVMKSGGVERVLEILNKISDDIPHLCVGV